jgi:hypothetical protein
MRRTPTHARVYWFPVRPARDGWGWGLPRVWQGWMVLALYVGALIAGMVMLAPFGLARTMVFVLALSAAFVGVVVWKGEP